ncbi:MULTISPECIES: homoserine O-acetyltransferase MetX [unclassified Pseudoclavibacter]|uniref:homoserine O-acetyltransferase MetX n=1 Tax=unclassified Pseudoclavibacter TaxID=2615177 RepID=UPI0015CD7E9D|nr:MULTISPECIES: homoserine O-acetyltransferase [unclassified Pseudoclavibacter]MBS3177619.1 homoserine O-acetyltransferase [Pseudoclavibacter sp. Marseille-Q4354]NYF13355.1 homoserine O-acetyltransferase [Pseudoclavibacter sp. JAI123]
MDWTDHGISPPSGRIPNDELRAASLRPPASGAWRDGDDVGDRQFAWLGAFSPEHGGELPLIRLAYETWGTLNADRSNAILVLHALTGDSHVEGQLGPGHPTAGWWPGIIGPGAPLDTDRYFVIAPNMLGGCQGSTGPASLDARGNAYGASFPVLTIRDQVRAQALLADQLGISTFAAVIGGSMGGMHALEWGIMHPDRTQRLIVMSAPAASDAQTIAQNTLQIDAIRLDPNFNDGDYADEPAGFGPHRGLALARRLAMLNYRSGTELDDRFGRSWQSNLSPEQDEGRYAVESYLDFHGNRFTRRFDANSYITLLTAMSSHNVGRDRGGVDAALGRVTASTMVIGISTDVLFPPETQHRIAAGVPNSYSGDRAVTIRSNFGHDGFLLEIHHVGDAIRSMLANG